MLAGKHKLNQKSGINHKLNNSEGKKMKYYYKNVEYSSEYKAINALIEDIEDYMEKRALMDSDGWHPSKLPYWKVFDSDGNCIKTSDEWYEEMYT